MNTTHLEHLETEISALPLSDQLWLMERMARQMRDKAMDARSDRESQIAAMAADPQIQQELREIAAEFAGTESAGRLGSDVMKNIEDAVRYCLGL